MEKLILKGFYDYVNTAGGRGELIGKIEVNPDGLFDGEIYDSGSRFPNQKIHGFLKHEDKLNKLRFLKSPPTVDLTNLFYSLSKEDQESFEGKYTGIWKALPYKISFNKDYHIFIAEMGKAICEISDKTEINIFRE